MMIALIAIVVVVGGALAFNSMNKGAMDTKETTETTQGMQTPTDSMQNGVMVGGAMMTPDKDIVDNAVGSKDHTTLVAAVTAAGLGATLKGPGPFTVFAPTNEAFAKLPAGTVDTLVMPENKAKLTGILTYHVVAGAMRAADLTDGKVLTTVNGQTLTVRVMDGKVMINDSVVQIADVISSNGVTHVIDTVLMPK